MRMPWDLEADADTPDGNGPLTPAPRLDGNGPTAPEGQSVSEPALSALAKSRPDLVEAYRAKMAGSTNATKDAQDQQDMGNYANTAGKLLNDFGNSQKKDVVLGNRIQDLGKAPSILKANRPEYDSSVINDVTKQGVDRAKQQRATDFQDFGEEQTLTDLGQKRADSDVSRQKAAREADPTSDESKQARDYLKTLAPSAANIPGFDTMSAARAREVAPQLMDKYKLDETIAERRSRDESASKDRGVKMAYLKDSQDTRAEARQDKSIDDAVGKLGTAMDPNKSRAGLLADNQKRLNNAERASALIYDDSGQIKNLNREQMGEAAQAWAAMIGNGNVQADAAITRLLPHTASGQIADVKQWITNEPQGSDQQAFLKMMADSIAREKTVAERQLKSAQVQTAAGSPLRKLSPERYAEVLKARGIDPADIDENGQYKPKSAALAPEDQEALKWATDNPNDPRAASIRKHLGAH